MGGTPSQQLERNINALKLRGQLAARPEIADLQQRGVYRTAGSATANLQLKKTVLGRALRGRASLEELKQKGLYLDGPVGASAALNKQLIAHVLERNLKSRTSVDSLKERGVYLNVAQPLEKEMAKNTLKRTLESRPDIADLKAMVSE